MATDPDPRPDETAADVLDTLTCVVVPTTEGDEQLDAVRRIATRLASRHDWHLVLYDRSNERWTDTPHPKGPMSIDELDGDRHATLIRQMRDVVAAGVSVSAWIATVPSITAMIDVLQELAVDGVMMPRHLAEPRLMDRLLEGSDPAEMVERVADLQLADPPVFLAVDDDGTISVEAYDHEEAA